MNMINRGKIPNTRRKFYSVLQVCLHWLLCGDLWWWDWTKPRRFNHIIIFIIIDNLSQLSLSLIIFIDNLSQSSLSVIAFKTITIAGLEFWPQFLWQPPMWGDATSARNVHQILVDYKVISSGQMWWFWEWDVNILMFRFRFPKKGA